MQVQEAAPLRSEQSAFLPQGDGLQGWITSIGRGAENKQVFNNYNIIFFL